MCLQSRDFCALALSRLTRNPKNLPFLLSDPESNRSVCFRLAACISSLATRLLVWNWLIELVHSSAALHTYAAAFGMLSAPSVLTRTNALRALDALLTGQSPFSSFVRSLSRPASLC